MSKQLRLRGAAWGLCLALMPAGHAMAQDELDQVPQPHYTQDPIGDAFVRIFDSTVPEQVYYWPPLLLIVPVDLNLDGRLDLLVSANYYRNGRQGEISQVFIREDQGYRDMRRPIAPGKLNSIIDFNYGAARIRQNPETNSVSFFDLSTGGGGDCVLYETRISSTTVEFRRIAELQAQDEEDFARTRLWRYLFEPLEPRIRYMNFGYLQIHYAARLHREPMKEERSASYSSPVPIDYRDPAQADKFFDSLEEAYALLDEMTTSSVSGPLEQAPEFDNVQIALEYYMKHNAPTWKPAPVEKLVPKFGEEGIIAALEPMSSNLEGFDQYFVCNTLAEIARLSDNTTVRQRFVEQILTGKQGRCEFESDRDWLAPFAGPDFDAGSKVFLLAELSRIKDRSNSSWAEGRIARWTGIANVEEALPILREMNVAQRGLKNRSHNPLFMRGALIALGRMGDSEAAREMTECIEGVKDPLDRALSLQRLATAPNPETVDYLKRYLFSDIVHAKPYSDWLPVSEAQCAADTLSVLLKEFPIGHLEEQRKWMENQTEYVFKPATTANLLPGLSP